jgi:hypothetical protein
VGFKRSKLLAACPWLGNLDAPTAGARNRTVGAHRARESGESLEALVIASASDPRGRILDVIRIPTGARFVKGKWIPQAAPFDYLGTVFGTGRGIFFDCKSVTAQHNTGFKAADPASLKPHQAGNLWRLSDAGAIAGILVRCGSRGDFRWLDGKHLRSPSQVHWDDPRWLILGPDSGRIPFRVLVESYEKWSSR